LWSQNIYLSREEVITFKSDAPLEIISVTSIELFGAIKLNNNNFAFKVV